MKEESREWTVDLKKAGMVRNKPGGLTFVMVDGAEYMVRLSLFSMGVAVHD